MGHGDPGAPGKGPAAAGRKAATQERILQAAMGLFARRGFDRTSVTQIAAKAGVSRGTVFWHFGNKETLFRATGKRFLVPFREALGGRLSHLEPRKRLFELFAVYERFVEENRVYIEAFVRWVLDSPRPARLLRDDLLGLHEAFRSEVEAALVELMDDAKEAAEIADGLLSLLNGDLLLDFFGARPIGGRPPRSGLKAISERILRGAGR